MLIGRIGGDLELKEGAGKKYANCYLATSIKTKDSEKTEWHNLVFFEKTAEIACKHVKKGDLICVDGSISYKEFTNKEGVKMKSTNIIVNNLTMLGGKKDDTKKEQEETQDDLPF